MRNATSLRLVALLSALVLLPSPGCSDGSPADQSGKGGSSAGAGRGGGGASGRGGGSGGGAAGLSGSAGRGGGSGAGGGGSAGVGGRGGSAGDGAAGSGNAGAAGNGAAGGSGGSATGGSGGSATGGSGGGAGTSGGSGTGGVGGTAGAAGVAGAGGQSGGTGTGGDVNCTLPPTDAGVPGPMPDNVVFLSNVTVSTLAGGASPGTADGATGVGMLNNPVSIVIEASGTLAISDFDNDRLRRANATDGTLSTLTAQSAFLRPFGLARVDTVLYAQTDTNPSGQRNLMSGTIWRIDNVSGVATVVGANVGRPRSFSALSDGRLVLADYLNQRIRILDPSNGTISELAGMQGCSGSANGTGSDARFVDLRAIAVLPGDRIVVADRLAHILREVSLAGVVTTFAGDGVAGTIDGPLAGARFDGPGALAVDDAGDLFVSDNVAHRIRRITAGGSVATVAGDGTEGFMNGAGNVAQFYGQEGIAVSADGATIYVADGTMGDEPPGPYNRIRKITVGP